MPTFLMISRHAPGNCPMFNEKARKLWLEYISKSEKLFKKHGAKKIGAWSVPTEHLYFEVVEIPSLDAFQKLGMEPMILAFGAYETYESKWHIAWKKWHKCYNKPNDLLQTKPSKSLFFLLNSK